MRKRDIEAVRHEMDRLRERIDVLFMTRGKDHDDYNGFNASTQDTAAIRRASMDLTRALARLRSG